MRKMIIELSAHLIAKAEARQGTPRQGNATARKMGQDWPFLLSRSACLPACLRLH